MENKTEKTTYCGILDDSMFLRYMENKTEKTTYCGIPKEIEEKVNSKQTVTDCGGIQPVNDITEIVFILDKSGSMAGLETDTIGGFNGMIERQKTLNGKAYISTILFSNNSEILHDRLPISDVAPLTDKDYSVGGGTALFDAIGGTIKHISAVHKYVRKEDVPKQTMFVITTDGMENASQNFNASHIKNLIEEKKKLGWEFLFVSANIDAVMAASSIGISPNRATFYTPSPNGQRSFFTEMNKTVEHFRRECCIRDDWADAIDDDNA